MRMRRGERFARDGAARSGYKAYACSKLALSMFARELQRRLRGAKPGVDVFLAHPGIAVTDAFRKSDKDKASGFWLDKIKNVLAQPAATGAVPLLYTATAPELEGDVDSNTQIIRVGSPQPVAIGHSRKMLAAAH
jgi:NAD(P)-dependent dehydrogenase (short-subunit alcohol dehydrogenase family)